MRCSDGSWDYTATCVPGLIKNATNITILIKDNVEIHISQFQYASPITLVFPNMVQPIKDKPVSVQPNDANIWVQLNDAKPIPLQLNEAQSISIQPNINPLPDRVQRNDAKPDRVQHNDSKPDRVQPNDAKPDQVQHNDAKPDRIQPNDAKPDQVQHNDAKPDRVPPNDAKPSVQPITDRPVSVQDEFTDRPIWPPLPTDLPEFLQTQPIKPVENPTESTDYDIDGIDWRIGVTNDNPTKNKLSMKNDPFPVNSNGVMHFPN